MKNVIWWYDGWCLRGDALSRWRVVNIGGYQNDVVDDLQWFRSWLMMVFDMTSHNDDQWCDWY